MISLAPSIASDLFGRSQPLDQLLSLALKRFHSSLTEFAVSPSFLTSMQIVFGENASPDAVLGLAKEWVNCNIKLPSIEIVSAETLNGAAGGYASATNTIYLSQSFLLGNTPSTVNGLLLEEFGHSLDSRLNSRDTPGDEGQIFSAFAQGFLLSATELQILSNENDSALININGQPVQIEQGRVFDSGGFEGSYQVITLDTTGGGFANFYYEHYTIPDNFILRYEGRNILETGFVGGSRSGSVQIPDGDSNRLEVIVATDNEGTAWLYDVNTLAPGLNIENAYAAVAGGSGQTASIKFPVILSESSEVAVTVNYFTLVGTAVDGVTGRDRIDYRPTTGTLTFAPGETRKEIEITVLGDTPVDFGGDKNYEIFARDTAYRSWQAGQDIDQLFGRSPYGDLGYRVKQFFNGPADFQAVGVTSDENFFVLISDPVNGEINKDSGAESDRLLTSLEEFLGPGFGTSDAYIKATQVLNTFAAQDTSWTFATGTIYDQGKAPVLAIRGTASGKDAWDDANPFGIGYGQYFGNRNNAIKWLQDVSLPEGANLSFKPSITGHSLGGAITQWFAADYSSQGPLGDIVTFNAPGISFAGANSFRGADSVKHYVTSTDVVSMAGFRFIPGQFLLSNETFSTFTQVPIYGPHTHPVLVPSIVGGSTKPARLSQGLSSSVNSLSFTYLPDPDYFVFLLAVSRIPLLGPTAATALLTRGTAEVARTTIGAVLYTAVDTGKFAVEFANAFVQSAWNASKGWSIRAWDAVATWGEETWDAVGSWTTTAWNATTQWLDQAWDATQQWSIDAWLATKQWSSHAWDATKQWSSDAWNATKHWSSDAWHATTQWTASAWSATKQWSSTAWDATTHWTSTAWDTTTRWSSDAWHATTQWTASAWDATTKWVGGLLPFSSDSLTAFQTSTNTLLLAHDILTPWDVIVQWSPEAWQATTQWSDAAWQATIQWTLDGWRATNSWTPQAWQSTTQWTDEIWQATTKLDPDAGDEVFFGSANHDILNGFLGQDILDGGDGHDRLDGGEGDDVLLGASGNDTLIGATGGDQFVINRPSESLDIIADFDHDEGDRLVISGAGFGNGLTVGSTLNPSKFILGASALDGDDRFIYDPSTGNLFFDQDGIGAAPQQLIATLTGAPALNSADFFISSDSISPTIKLNSVTKDASGTGARIEWNAFDADSEAKISLYYDTDNQGFDGLLIADGLMENDGMGGFSWDLSQLAGDIYYVYAKISDEETPSVYGYAKERLDLTPDTGVDLSVTKIANKTTLQLGDIFTYTIQVVNNSSVVARDIAVVETLQEPVSFITASLSPVDQTDNTYVFDLGDLPANESRTIEITVAAPSLLTGPMTSMTTVSSQAKDPDTTNNVATLVTNVVAQQQPDLTITGTGHSGVVNIGDRYGYTFTVMNNGSSEATGVVLTEFLPAVINVINATSSAPSLQKDLVDIVAIQLNSGEQVTIDIDANSFGSTLDSILRLFDSTGAQLRVSDDNPAPGEALSLDSYIDFTATTSGTYYVGVSGYSNDYYSPIFANTGATTSSAGSYSLEIKVGTGGSTRTAVLAEPNNTIFQAVNSGLSSANPGTFIGTGLISRGNDSPISIGNGLVTAYLGNIAAGGSATLDLTVSPIAAGELISTANVRSDQSDANPLDNLIVRKQVVKSTAPDQIDLELTQTVSNANPAIGQVITLTLTLVNDSLGTATNIQVRDLLPSQLEFISASTVQGSYDINTGIWNVGNMRDNLSRTLTITARVNGGQLLTNIAEVTAVYEDDKDSVPNNNNPNEDDQDVVLIDVKNVSPVVQANKILAMLEDASATSLDISPPTDANGDLLSITIATIPDATKGQVLLGNSPLKAGDSLNAQQLSDLVFTPVLNANGSAGNLSYTVNDAHGGTATQSIILSITPVNDPPLALDDTATAAQSTQIVIPVLANDSDLDGDSISLFSFDLISAQGGSITRDNNGSPGNLSDDKLFYTSSLGFSGTDSFTYSISDGTMTSAATVHILVTPPANLPPIAANDSAVATQNTPLVIPKTTLLSNDYDPDFGDRLTISGVANVSNGSLQLNPESVMFVPEPGFIGIADFLYTITDGRGGTSNATVTITVNPFLGTAGRDTIIGTDLDDQIIGGLGADVLTGKLGKDHFLYQNMRDAGDVVKDFEVGSDKIDFRPLFGSLGYVGSDPISAGILKFGSRGVDSVVLIDEDGLGMAKRPLPFLTIVNVPLLAMQNPANFIF